MKTCRFLPFAALIILAACNKEPANHPPVIEGVRLEAQGGFIPGYAIGVTALVSDQDGDDLTYLWESTGGDIREPDRNPTSWELYTTAEPMSYEKITVTVSDGKALVSHSSTIQVAQGLTVSGKTCFWGTTIPVGGVTVSIGQYSTVSGDDGSYTIKSLKEGIQEIRASKQGFDLFQSSEYVDNPISYYNIPMTSSTQTSPVTGLIRTIDSIALEGLSVTVLNPDDSESELTGATSVSGSYGITGVPHGTRKLLIRSGSDENHFLNDSLVISFELDGLTDGHDVRIKIPRVIITDSYLSEQDKWIFDGEKSDGFYLLRKGQMLELKDFIHVPRDAEKPTVHLKSYVVGGCHMVGSLPSHRVWISDTGGAYLGGISWGGDGTNFNANVSWVPSDPPTFLDIFGKDIKLNVELSGENSCIPNPEWRVYEIGFTYYH